MALSEPFHSRYEGQGRVVSTKRKEDEETQTECHPRNFLLFRAFIDAFRSSVHYNMSNTCKLVLSSRTYTENLVFAGIRDMPAAMTVTMHPSVLAVA